jgi:hypothetical protein
LSSSIVGIALEFPIGESCPIREIIIVDFPIGTVSGSSSESIRLGGITMVFWIMVIMSIIIAGQVLFCKEIPA